VFDNEKEFDSEVSLDSRMKLETANNSPNFYGERSAFQTNPLMRSQSHVRSLSTFSIILFRHFFHSPSSSSSNMTNSFSMTVARPVPCLVVEYGIALLIGAAANG
jgi:hypothetical protein